MFINYEMAKKVITKLYPKCDIAKSATYEGSHIFFLRNKSNPLLPVEPICIDENTGAISVYIPKDEKMFREVGKLLK